MSLARNLTIDFVHHDKDRDEYQQATKSAYSIIVLYAICNKIENKNIQIGIILRNVYWFMSFISVDAIELK